MATKQIIFAGTPEFAVPTLTALIAANYDIVGVYTQPDRPAGRGKKLTTNPIKQLAQKFQLSTYQPTSLRNLDTQKQLQQLNADIMVVVAYGLILPEAVLTIPKRGCINVHASLLPRWRGAAPIQHAILAGDSETGITTMQMDVGLDTGPILKQARCSIHADDTSGSLHKHLAELGAKTLITTLNDLDRITPIPQNHKQATLAPKIEKQQGRINWQLSARELEQQIRAFNPWPIAYCEFQQQTLRLWEAKTNQETSQEEPGTIIATDKTKITVATGNGQLQLLTLQLPGGKPISAGDFINAHKHLVGIRLY